MFEGQTKASQNSSDTNTSINYDCFRAADNSINSKIPLDSQTKDQNQGKFSNKLNHNNEENCRQKSVQSNEMKHRNAMKLINLQKDTMNTQNRDLLELDSEINFWDNKFQRDEEVRRQLEIEALHLEKVLNEQEDQIKDLEAQNLDRELERFERESEKIETAKNKLRSQLNEMENKIATCRQSIHALTEEISRKLFFSST